MKKKTHGGRRHGLSASGPSPATTIRLGDAAGAALTALTQRSGMTDSEVIRTLLLHPNASDAIDDWLKTAARLQPSA